MRDYLREEFEADDKPSVKIKTMEQGETMAINIENNKLELHFGDDVIIKMGFTGAKELAKHLTKAVQLWGNR